MMQRQNVHRQRDRAVQQKPEPDAVVFITEPAQKNSSENRGETFRHRLAEMNHTIRHGHHKYRIKSERFFKTVNEKSAKKEFQAEKLQKIQKLPNQKRGTEIRLAVVDLQKRVFTGKTVGQRNHINQRQHHGGALQI